MPPQPYKETIGLDTADIVPEIDAEIARITSARKMLTSGNSTACGWIVCLCDREIGFDRRLTHWL